MSTRVSGTSTVRHPAAAHSPKIELASLQAKIRREFVSSKAKVVKAPSKAEQASAERLVVNQGVDMATVAYKVGGKMYAASTGFTGITQWVELPASDLKRFEALKKDLGHAALKTSTWSSEGPRFLNGSDALDITPKGELGVGYKAYVFGGELWLAKTPVVPNAKTLWAKL